MGGYERDSQPAFLPDGPAGLDAIPPDFNGRLLEDDWDRFDEITENSKRRVPVMDEVKITKLINGPEAFTPDNEFCLGESEVRGVLRRRWLLRPRPRRRRRDRPGDRRVDRRGRAEPRPLGDGRAPLRRPVPLAAYTHARIRETYETYYDIRYPNHERSAGRPLRRLGGQRLARRPRRRVRREVGLGAGQLVRVERRARATSRCARAAGPASTGRRRSAPSTARRARRWRSSTSRSFAKLEIAGPGAAALLERLCDNRVARDVGQITYTQMLNQPRRDRVRLHRRAARRGAVLDRHRDRVRQPRPRVDPQAPAPRTARPRSATSPRPGRASGSGGRGRATCSRR